MTHVRSSVNGLTHSGLLRILFLKNTCKSFNVYIFKVTLQLKCLLLGRGFLEQHVKYQIHVIVGVFDPEKTLRNTDTIVLIGFRRHFPESQDNSCL